MAFLGLSKIDHLSGTASAYDLTNGKFPMTLERSVVIEKKTRKTPAKVRGPLHPLHPLTAHVAILSPAKVAASHKRTPAFDPLDPGSLDTTFAAIFSKVSAMVS